MFPNPLNIHDIRQLDHCPPHFLKVTFDLRANKKDINDWIYERLHGRFYAGDLEYIADDNGKTQMKYVVAFEDHSEASYFSLFLPEINTTNTEAF